MGAPGAMSPYRLTIAALALPHQKLAVSWPYILLLDSALPLVVETTACVVRQAGAGERGCVARDYVRGVGGAD